MYNSQFAIIFFLFIYIYPLFIKLIYLITNLFLFSLYPNSLLYILYLVFTINGFSPFYVYIYAIQNSIH